MVVLDESEPDAESSHADTILNLEGFGSHTGHLDNREGKFFRKAIAIGRARQLEHLRGQVTDG